MAEITKAEEDASEAVKAALVISGADKTRFGRLKDELANNYLLGIDQYPDTYKKAMRILGHYQTPKAVLRSSSKEGEDADAEVGEAEPDEARQQKTAQKPEEEMALLRRQDQETQQALQERGR